MSKLVSAMDVAAYILRARGAMSTWKLQKLCYYCQAWSLVWDDSPLFRERIEAWAGGPVVPKLYQWHRGRYQVSVTPNGNPDILDKDQRETVDAVLDGYASRSAAELSALTHSESPWRDARWRAGLQPGERGNAQIRLDSMAEFYSGLLYDGEED